MLYCVPITLYKIRKKVVSMRLGKNLLSVNHVVSAWVTGYLPVSRVRTKGYWRQKDLLIFFVWQVLCQTQTLLFRWEVQSWHGKIGYEKYEYEDKELVIVQFGECWKLRFIINLRVRLTWISKKWDPESNWTVTILGRYFFAPQSCTYLEVMVFKKWPISSASENKHTNQPLILYNPTIAIWDLNRIFENMSMLELQGSIQIARPVREQLFSRTTVRVNSCSREQLLPDHMTNHEMLWNWMVCMVSWMQLVTNSIICL